MNAPVSVLLRSRDASFRLRVDSRARTAAANGRIVHLDGDQLVMVRLLARSYPKPVHRDHILKTVFSGNRPQGDPASCLRQTFRRVRLKIHPLGVAVQHIPSPEGTRFSGHYSLAVHDPCSHPVRQR